MDTCMRHRSHGCVSTSNNSNTYSGPQRNVSAKACQRRAAGGCDKSKRHSPLRPRRSSTPHVAVQLLTRLMKLCCISSRFRISSSAARADGPPTLPEAGEPPLPAGEPVLPPGLRPAGLRGLPGTPPVLSRLTRRATPLRAMTWARVPDSPKPLPLEVAPEAVPNPA